MTTILTLAAFETRVARDAYVGLGPDASFINERQLAVDSAWLFVVLVMCNALGVAFGERSRL